MTTTDPLLPITHFVTWLAKGERGMSSEAIVEHLTGIPVGQRSGGATPFDPSDFRRCHLLLEAVPLARLAFGSMRSASPAWARFVDAWDELTALYVEEHPSGRAPRLYARMRELNYPTTPTPARTAGDRREDHR